MDTGRGLTACSMAGLEFVRVWGQRAVLYWWWAAQKQRQAASSQKEQLRAEIRHRVSISDQRNQGVGAFAFAATGLVLGTGRGPSCLLASFSAWHRL